MTVLQDIDPTHANIFAEALANRVAGRVRGADPASARLLERRPGEHILTGFLTPLRAELIETWKSEPVEDDAGPQPPVDDPDELTNIGCEWLVPTNVDTSSGSLCLTLRLNVYVRVLPTFDELTTRIRYTASHAARRASASGEASQKPRDEAQDAALPEVWRRLALGEVQHELSLSSLWNRKRTEASLRKVVAERFAAAISDSSELYPSRLPLRISRVDAATAETYSRWCAAQHRTARANDAEWHPSIDVRVGAYPGDPSLRRVSLRVVNCTAPVSGLLERFIDPNLYDVDVTLEFPSWFHRSGTFRELDSSYRYDRSIPAIGLNCDARPLSPLGPSVRIRLATVPLKWAPRLDPRDIPNAIPTFTTCARDPVPLLKVIAVAMRNYHREEWLGVVQRMEDRQREADGVEQGRIAEELREAKADCAAFVEDEIRAFENGVAFLADPEFGAALRAFKLMNEAMGRVGAQKGYDAWRLFQLVFIVKSLPELAVRYQPAADRYATTTGPVVDILSFAAGGGKTEAFSGLLLWQLFFDRLSGKHFGVTAMVRFPLRLLTFQQLQRLAFTLAQADRTRFDHDVPGEEFSLGYFVGGTQTPNSINAAQHERFTRQGPDDSLRRLARCPYCLAPGIELHYDASNRLVQHRCTNGNCCNPRSAIPLYIVDDDVYRFLPSVIVSTVDKLANIGQNRRFANLFGRIDRRCAKHGAAFASSNWLCSASKAAFRGERPDRCDDRYNVRYGPFAHLSPALQIADELHLLRQELGAFDGHYETTAFEVQRSLGAQPWKVIAATATIERFQEHARELYALPARRFPNPGPSATESFYYRESGRRGRLFMGVLGVARAHTPAVARAKSLFLQEVDAIRRDADHDPAGLSASLGLPPLDRNELRRLAFLYEIVLTYVLTLKGGDQVSEAIDNRVRQELAESSPGASELVVKMLNSGVAMTEMIATMEEIAGASVDADPDGRIRALVTTNIVSHGVDVDRFGVIIFAGFPRQVAEYIQASARVGRTWPGISVFIPTPQAERDRSVLDRFGKFHEYVDRLIEPSAINRWPQPILRRTGPGVLCAYLMGVAAARLGNELHTVQQVQRRLGDRDASCLNADEVVRWCLRALRVDAAASPAYAIEADRAIRNLYDRVLRRSTINDATERTQLSQELDAMKSLRDVDVPAQVAVEDADEQDILGAFLS